MNGTNLEISDICLDNRKNNVSHLTTIINNEERFQKGSLETSF